MLSLRPASAELSSQEMLEQLDSANLFLVPLDSERTWYRYHHLFADLLQARLFKCYPCEMPELHRKAGDWLENQDRISEAIEHLLDAQAFLPACQLIDTQVEQLVGRSDMFRMLGWIRRLPKDLARSRPWLCIAQAWSALFLDDVAQIELFLQAAESAIPEDSPAELRDAWLG
ncbi:MAG TPA: hypothetical protein VMJ64_17925, partial [Anaerolineales bacterium]|nr:hypothetical protein [Anaerolineales bacterium]